MKLSKEFFIASFLGLFFGATILGISFVRLSVNQHVKVVAKDNVKVVQKKEEVDYPLPYPGILPDSPFYWIKMIRDRVQLMVLKSPEKRAEKMVHYADKRLAAAVRLINKGKVQLGVTTASKAEKYLERAVLSFNEVEGKQLQEKMRKAVKKHLQVIISFENKFSSGEIRRMKERVQRLEKRLQQLQD
jgi:polyhydroxyalkanoate synthesis regulator phasin